MRRLGGKGITILVDEIFLLVEDALQFPQVIAAVLLTLHEAGQLLNPSHYLFEQSDEQTKVVVELGLARLAETLLSS